MTSQIFKQVIRLVSDPYLRDTITPTIKRTVRTYKGNLKTKVYTLPSYEISSKSLFYIKESNIVLCHSNMYSEVKNQLIERGYEVY